MQLENSFTIEAPLDKAWAALNTPETVAPCFPGATLTEYEGDSFTGTVKVKLGPISLTYKGKGTYVERDEGAHRVVIEAAGRDSRGNGTANATVTGTLTADGADKTGVKMVTDMTITGRPAQFGRGVISDVADKIIGQFASCVARKLAPGAEAGGSDEPAGSGAGAAGGSGGGASGGSGSGAAGGSGGGASGSATSSGAAPASGASSPAGEAAGSSNGSAGAGAAAPTVTATSPAPSSTPAAPTAAAPSPVPTRSVGPVRSEVDAIDLLDTAGSPVLKRLAPVAGGGLLLLLVILLIRRLRG